MFQTAVIGEVNSSENEDVTSLEAAADKESPEDEYSLFILCIQIYDTFIINAGRVVFICDVPPLIGLRDTSKTKCAPIWYLIFCKYERFSDYKSV